MDILLDLLLLLLVYIYVFATILIPVQLKKRDNPAVTQLPVLV